METKIRSVVIVHASAEWRSFHRRGMLTALADSLPDSVATLIINRPITLDVGPWKHTRKFFSGFWKSAFTHEGRGLFVLTPRLPLHEIVAARLPAAVKLNAALMRQQLLEVVDSRFPNATRFIQWIYYPSQSWVWGALGGHGKVYECYDDYPRASGGGFDEKAWKAEIRVLQEADLTFATAQSILNERIAHSRRLEHLPNGVPDFFFDPAPELANDPIHLVPHPRIGYLGNIFSHLDYPLLEQLCGRNPDWHLVLVGPVENERAVIGLRGRANVHFLGPRPYAQVPTILRQLDVGLIPFLDNQFTRAINPLKLYEYLAVGLPTVATYLPELERFADVIRLKKCEVLDFEVAIRDSLAEERNGSRKALIDSARAYSWTSIARNHVIPPLAEVFHL